MEDRLTPETQSYVDGIAGAIRDEWERSGAPEGISGGTLVAYRWATGEVREHLADVEEAYFREYPDRDIDAIDPRDLPSFGVQLADWLYVWVDARLVEWGAYDLCDFGSYRVV